MVRKNQKTGWFIAGALLFVAPAVFGSCTDNPPTPAPGTACMAMVDPGTTGYPFASIYAGPYDASINGGPSTKVICDDFFDDSFIPDIGPRMSLAAADLIPGTRMAALANGTDLPALSGSALTNAYNEVGYLALQLLMPHDQYTEAEIHFALWSIFDPAALSYLSDPGVEGAAAGFRQAAIDAVTNPGNPNYSSDPTSFISQFTIYTPDTQAGNYISCPGNTCGPNRPPQEFLVKTPEPPFFALLGVDLSGVGALLFLLRRRRSGRP